MEVSILNGILKTSMMTLNSPNRDRQRGSRRRAVLLQISDFGLGRGLFLSEALSAAGLDVSVITNQPIYQQVSSKSKDNDPNITTYSVGIPFASALYRTIFGRLIVYCLFTAISFLMMMRIRAQILYSRGPQPFTEISCLAYRLFDHHVKIISDTTDLWPDSLEYVNVNHTLKTILMPIGLAINRVVHRHVDAIITHNAELANILQQRFGKPTHIIHGVIDLERFRSMKKEEVSGTISAEQATNLAGKFVILYSGILGPFTDPFRILSIADRLDEGVTILVVGTGPFKEQLQSRAFELNLHNIVFLGTQPFDKMPFLYNLADAYLLTLTNIPFLRICLPKKFIEYAACGKPILCVTPRCVASDLAVAWKAGYWFEPNNIVDTVSVIKQLKDDHQMREKMGNNARQLAENLFSIRAATETLKGLPEIGI
jgi:glycosyltransferase involved in cell wall biosynthesis